MLAYFVRRLFGGLITLFVVPSLLFLVLWEAPGGLRHPVFGHARLLDTRYAPRNATPEQIQLREKLYHLDKVWPFNYIEWLFDPDAVDVHGTPKGFILPFSHIYVPGSGAVAADFGLSRQVLLIPDSPNLGDDPWDNQLTRIPDLMIPEGSGMLAYLLVISVVLVLVVAAQRWHRPQPYRVSSIPTSTALVDWWYLHSRRPIDAAVFRGHSAC